MDARHPDLLDAGVITALLPGQRTKKRSLVIYRQNVNRVFDVQRETLSGEVNLFSNVFAVSLPPYTKSKTPRNSTLAFEWQYVGGAASSEKLDRVTSFSSHHLSMVCNRLVGKRNAVELRAVSGDD